MRTLLETFWEIVLSLLGALALAGLTILASVMFTCAALAGCGWIFWRRKRRFAGSRKNQRLSGILPFRTRGRRP